MAGTGGLGLSHQVVVEGMCDAGVTRFAASEFADNAEVRARTKDFLAGRV